MMKKSVKDCVFLNCAGYTAAAVICSILCYIPGKLMNADYRFYLELFVCSTLICTLLYYISRLPIESVAFTNLISIFVDFAVIVGVGGGVFHWFSWKAETIILAAAIIVAVFAITTWAVIERDRELARKINEKINEV